MRKKPLRQVLNELLAGIGTMIAAGFVAMGAYQLWPAAFLTTPLASYTLAALLKVLGTATLALFALALLVSGLAKAFLAASQR